MALVIFSKKINLLHFAPEKVLTKFFELYSNINYLSVDIDPKKAMFKQDITKLTFKDNSFDIVFCSHVLEHVENDIKAMKEVFRVLKKDGFAILQVPIKRKKTYENFMIKSLKEREKIFGQSDHVRIYGEDYKNRLEKAGFKVKKDYFFDSLSEDIIKKYGLKREIIYYCKK
jgi:ubiquinone/menaquinone biosynthesis C-methylase UbiE